MNGALKQLSTALGESTHWSPDGRRLDFVRSAGWGGDIRVMDVAR